MNSCIEDIEACILTLFPDAYDGEFLNKKGVMEPVFFVKCPGWLMHSTPNKETDACIRYSDPDYPPFIFCFHQQCQRDREVMSAALHAVMRKRGCLKRVKRKRAKTPEQRQKLQAETAAKGIQKKFGQLFETLDDSFFDRRLWLPESRSRFLDLYSPDEVLWNGEKHESGAYGVGRFRSAAEWREVPIKVLGQFTTPGVYRPGETSRTKAALSKLAVYFIIEFDFLDPDPVRNQIKTWILVHWLAKIYNLKLRLCVDSGGKSLHFWVEMTPNITPYVFHILEKLGADNKVLRSGAQPVRFPGVIRRDTNKPQCVIEL